MRLNPGSCALGTLGGASGESGQGLSHSGPMNRWSLLAVQGAGDEHLGAERLLYLWRLWVKIGRGGPCGLCNVSDCLSPRRVATVAKDD